MDPTAHPDSPCTPGSVDLLLPRPIISSKRRRIKSVSCGGVPLSVLRGMETPSGQLTMLPKYMSLAKDFLGKMPPPPPGVPKMRRCKGCHGYGYNDKSHESYPIGANRCPLDHSENCEGGIVDGADYRGREWRACHDGYVPLLIGLEVLALMMIIQSVMISLPLSRRREWFRSLSI